MECKIGHNKEVAYAHLHEEVKIEHIKPTDNLVQTNKIKKKNHETKAKKLIIQETAILAVQVVAACMMKPNKKSCTNVFASGG